MNPNSVVTRFVAKILDMVPWRAGDQRGEYLQDPNQVVHLDEEALATIERMDFDPETVLRHGDEGNGGEEGIPEQNEWPLEGGPNDWRRQLDRDSLPRRITTAPNNFIWLGRYFPMAPRGVIQLHEERLGYFFWKLLLKLIGQHAITAYQLSRLAEATVLKTLSHEAFHHRSDLVRLLHGDNSPHYSPLVEEALAVASSWHHVRQQGRDWDMPEALWDGFLTEAYRYTAPGYRDWETYRGSDFFWGFQNHALSPRAIAVLGRHGRCETTTWEMGRRYRMMQKIFGLYPGRFDLEDGFDWHLPYRLADRYGFFAPDYSMAYLESGRVHVEVVVNGGRVVREYS